MIEVISKNGNKIDIFSEATEWEVLHKSNSKFRLKSVDKAHVALEGATPIKFILYTIEEVKKTDMYIKYEIEELFIKYREMYELFLQKLYDTKE